MITLIDGTTQVPDNGQTGWGSILNAAIAAIDGRFTYQSPTSIPATKALASGLTGTTLASNVVASSLTSVGTLSSLTVGGNVTVNGDFTVNGTTTTVNTTTLTVSDNIITLNNDVTTGAPSENAGIEVRRGSSSTVSIRWNESTDLWEYTLDGTNFVVFNAAGSLTGTTLASNVVTSSLTSTGTLTSLTVNGPVSRGAPVTKTGNFSLGSNENNVICNGTASITVTLPAASGATGREVLIKNTAAFTVISNASNVVPRAGGAAGTAILAATAGSWARLVSDGTNWIIMAGA